MVEVSNPPSLLTWLIQRSDDDFPPARGLRYTARMQQVAGILSSEIHPYVGTGAALADGGFLTDHGSEHVDTVIQRATCLLAHPSSSYPQFSAYEVYILLMAIHFHDVGNIFGRKDHEVHHAKVSKLIRKHLGDEMVERQAVLKVAAAHGGKVNGSKDAIGRLPQDGFVLGQRVRYRALAALLRFADEIADDCHRAARYGEALGIIPQGSEVFHAYAKSLHSVIVEPESNVIQLHFSFLRRDALRKYGKKSGSKNVGLVHLLDEIFVRTLKMHLERIYCLRFLTGVVQFDAIDVSISIYRDENSLVPCIDPIVYRLQEQGYPHPTSSCLKHLCPEIDINGDGLCELLKEETN